MTGVARLRQGLLCAGLAVAVALVVHAWRVDSLPAAQVAAPAPCSSCDARHARLSDRRTDILEVQE